MRKGEGEDSRGSAGEGAAITCPRESPRSGITLRHSRPSGDAAHPPCLPTSQTSSHTGPLPRPFPLPLIFYEGLPPPSPLPPPQQEYIRHLILSRLSKATVSEVAKKLLKVPWAENERSILKCLLKASGGQRVSLLPFPSACAAPLSRPPFSPSLPPLSQTFHHPLPFPSSPPLLQVVRGRFTNIGLVSALVGGLAQVHDSLGIAFVDQVGGEEGGGGSMPLAQVNGSKWCVCVCARG